jgi:hypothetical protein
MALKVYEKLKQSIRYWLFRRLPVCQDIVKDISRSMEQRLTLRERVNVRVHLWICAWCQRYLEHLQLIHHASQATPFDNSDLPGLSVDARERIRNKLTSQS